jgi:hypothetical protein
MLCDGLPIRPRELSARVHKPSTTVADLVRREAMRRRNPTRSKCAPTADQLWNLTWQVIDVDEKRIERRADDSVVTYERHSGGGARFGDMFPED